MEFMHWLIATAGFVVVAGAYYAMKTYDEVVSLRKELKNLVAFVERSADQRE